MNDLGERTEGEPGGPPGSDSAGPAATAATPQESTSYGKILSSSALIGGASALSIGIGALRTKALALMLGPGGFGLLGLYSAIVDLAATAAALGVGSSGVRQIAESAGSGDAGRIGLTATVVRRATLLLACLGGLAVVALARPISLLTFGDDAHTAAVALLGLAVFFRVVAAGQGALVQGLRRIADLARIGVFGALFSALGAVTFVYFSGEDGVVLAVVLAAGIALAVSWRYSRRIALHPTPTGLPEMTREMASLLKVGAAFMGSGVLTMGAAYAARTIVLHAEGFEGAGHYSAAWTVGGLYVGVVLQALGADFYPRLVAAAGDDGVCNRLVNEQTRVSMLLAWPGILATLTFAPLVVTLFYSGEFAPAADVLRWICLGAAMRVLLWPMGLILIAKSRPGLFFAADAVWTLANGTLTWVCVAALGLPGAGVAFFLAYLVQSAVVYPAVNRITGFRPTAENLRSGALFVGATALVLTAVWSLPQWIGLAVATGISAAVGLYALRVLAGLVDGAQMPAPLRRVLVALRL